MGRVLCTTICFAFLSLAASQPVDFFPKFSFSSKSERSWLWSWAWGAESTVSVVDRFPALSYPSRPAGFGAELAEPLLGYVIPLNSFTIPCNSNASLPDQSQNLGCPQLCVKGPHVPTEKWIALVQRGKCEFVSKVREAQRLGARGVVVGGSDPNVSGNPDTLVNMYSPEDASDVTIASTFIRYSDYMELSALIAASNTSHSGLRTLSLLITTDYSAWEWYSPMITFIIILLLPSSLTFITLLVHRVRAARAAQRDRAPEDVVRNLPWRVWTGTGWEKHEGSEDPNAAPTASSPDVDVERNITSGLSDPSTSHCSKPLDGQPWFEMQQECAICLSEFVKDDKVRVLPCHHIFHLDEVDLWLIQRKKLCPVCKADVTQPPHTQEPHSSEMEAQTETEIQTIPSSASRSSSLSPTERTPLLGTPDSVIEP